LRHRKRTADYGREKQRKSDDFLFQSHDWRLTLELPDAAPSGVELDGPTSAVGLNELLDATTANSTGICQ
jgi:hypothetical protein